MGSTYVPFARAAEAVDPKKADRTAARDVRAPIDSPRWGDVEVRTWPNRAAMVRVIRRDERNAPYSDWRPSVPLGLTEGY